MSSSFAMIPTTSDLRGLPKQSADIRNPQYQALKGRIHEELLGRLNLERLARVKREDAEPEIRSLISNLLDLESQNIPLSLFERDALVVDVLHEIFGLGPLEGLLADPEISDILVNRHNQIYLERNGRLEESDVVFQNDAHLLRIIERIVSMVGRRIDESSPMVDARLQDGSRVNAVIPPLALDGPCMSIRRFRTDRIGAQDLVERQSLTQPMLDFLRDIVAARLNIIVSGGTGAGKTTLLNALSSFISDRERIVTIEDAAELTLKQRHTVRLETRPPNIEGQGAVRQRQLVVNALRMRPDRIIVGEVRGEEALDMLQAMNTGHDGSLTTIHANTPRDALLSIGHDGRDGEPEHPRSRRAEPDCLGRERARAGLADGGRHAKSDLDCGDHRDGAGRDHDAGDLPLRADGPDPRGQGHGAVPRHRRPAEMRGAARDHGRASTG